MCWLHNCEAAGTQRTPTADEGSGQRPSVDFPGPLQCECPGKPGIFALLSTLWETRSPPQLSFQPCIFYFEHFSQKLSFLLWYDKHPRTCLLERENAGSSLRERPAALTGKGNWEIEAGLCRLLPLLAPAWWPCYVVTLFLFTSLASSAKARRENRKNPKMRTHSLIIANFYLCLEKWTSPDTRSRV